ncbi:MAG TPA: hypothetical protein VKG92_00450 [Flavobacteriales bacterium]|nr:hypothetical protein [Flavobacteriales bacterium]
METKIILVYLIYLPVTILLTLYVAHTLFKNGRIFMLDIFKGKEDIANATNKLFEVGFYLLNIGFALLILKIKQEEPTVDHFTDAGAVMTTPNVLDTNQEVVEALASKIGGFAIYLGVMLFFNLYLFFRGRRKARMHQPPPMPITIGALPTA